MRRVQAKKLRRVQAKKIKSSGKKMRDKAKKKEFRQKIAVTEEREGKNTLGIRGRCI